MGSIKTREAVIDGLTCVNCAAKIECEINKIDGVKHASVNMMTNKLYIEAQEKQPLDEVFDKVIGVVKDIEPDVKILYSQNEAEQERQDIKREMLLFLASSVIFVAGLILKVDDIIKFLLFFTSYMLAGWKVLKNATTNIVRGKIFDENFLMGIATIGAFAVGQFPEGAAVMLFYRTGELLQDKAVDRSRRSIKELMNIRPDYANLKIDGGIKKVSPELAKVDDLILVKPGEKIPLDGIIEQGSSMVDTSALTGESVPRKVGVGGQVLSGFINKNGLLTVRVTKEFEESTASKVLNLVEKASSNKAPTEDFITRFARFYTPVVVITALFLAVIPPLVIRDAVFSDWIYRALIFLVISCPCALVLSIPLGFFGGIGAASKEGVLVKGGNYLEALNKIDTIVFDKTGTLTKGVFDVVRIVPVEGVSSGEILRYAAIAESYSNHPIASSILKEYGQQIDKSIIKSFQEMDGYGVKVITKEHVIVAGNKKMMEKERISYEIVSALGTVVYISVDNRYMGYIVISDEIKDDSRAAIREIKSTGINRTVMLTGDSESIGKKVAVELGIDEVYAEMLPHQKVEKIEEIFEDKNTKGKIAFVGDGLNDAPVLARADIGIAMGALGSDAAIEAADIVIMNDEPSKIISAINISKKTKKIVLQNIVFALGVKVIVLILGAAGMAQMWEAVFADVGVSLIAVLNSLRILKS
ncbi:MAG: heavy metal translocating P-type ATPase [Clostridia bacterium]|nr:heavy metal translocating P-type ATPase [Clostridia bacterium]